MSISDVLGNSWIAVGATIVTVLMASFFSLLLKEYASRINRTAELRERLEALSLSFATLQQSKSESTENVASTSAGNDHEAILNDVISRLGSEVADEAIVSMKAKLAPQVMLDSLDRFIRETTDRIMARIQDELAWTRKRAALNLQMGVYVTFIAVAALAYSVFAINGDSTNGAIGYIEMYAPRFSLIILIEVFAYFFLRMHKDNIKECRSLTNEKNTLEGKLLGIRIAARSSVNLEAAIIEFTKLERTLILQRGQSTVEIEGMKFQALADNALLDRLTKLIGILRPVK